MHSALTIQCIVKFLLVNFPHERAYRAKHFFGCTGKNWGTIQGYDSNRLPGMRSEVGILIPNIPYPIF